MKGEDGDQVDSENSVRQICSSSMHPAKLVLISSSVVFNFLFNRIDEGAIIIVQPQFKGGSFLCCDRNYFLTLSNDPAVDDCRKIEKNFSSPKKSNRSQFRDFAN